MIGKTGFFLTMAGLAVLAVPEKARPGPPEISATLAIPDAPAPAGPKSATAEADKNDPRPAAIQKLANMCGTRMRPRRLPGRRRWW
jgi:hypothetical protein